MDIKTLKHGSDTKGFTILELSISLVILTMLSLFGGQLYLNYTNSSRDIKAANLVYEEARFLMERIVRDVRQSAIDYEEYFNHNVMIPYIEKTENETGSYGQHYCSYSALFYDDKGESIGRRNSGKTDAFSFEGLDPEAVRNVEQELYLINLNGTRRTMMTRVTKDISGAVIGKVAMLKMVGRDFGEDGINGRDSYNGLAPHDSVNCKPDDRENDGKIDTWLCDPDFPCKTDEETESQTVLNCRGYRHVAFNDPQNPDYSFVDISPNVINVVDLKFMITPEDDPWKAYNINDVQVQPHVTIQLTAQAHPFLVDMTDRTRLPSVTLTSTVTTRNYNEINSDCR